MNSDAAAMGIRGGDALVGEEGDHSGEVGTLRCSPASALPTTSKPLLDSACDKAPRISCSSPTRTTVVVPETELCCAGTWTTSPVVSPVGSYRPQIYPLCRERNKARRRIRQGVSPSRSSTKKGSSDSDSEPALRGSAAPKVVRATPSRPPPSPCVPPAPADARESVRRGVHDEGDLLCRTRSRWHLVPLLGGQIARYEAPGTMVHVGCVSITVSTRGGPCGSSGRLRSSANPMSSR